MISDLVMPDWVSKAFIDLEVETTKYNGPWIRFGDSNLPLNDDNFYTVRIRKLLSALHEKDAGASSYISFHISSEIRYFLFEKKFCKEIQE